MSPQRIGSGADEIAVEITPGKGPPILWLGGFRSDMTGSKALRLAQWGAEKGRKVVRFDYRGHGASSGTFEDFVLSDWLADAEMVMGRFCDEAPVAVGSSMGGWIGLLLAKACLARGRPLAGLVLIAPAADFTERLMLPRLPEAARKTLAEEGRVDIPSNYDAPYTVTARLFEDGRQHLLYTDDMIDVGCPVHILQGVEDDAVPYGHTLELVERLAHDDVVLTLVKDGDHRLSREADLARLIAAVEGLV
ncbi:alpha/beta hydrolase [Acuticoccus sp. MNP-M23]|nr:alpha/beta hydrolase [Acuticoccus sp. MNP-M23]WMS44127.1 alpha/beta hydrolase [Acuticoccus sp. MNP-M23]